MSVKPSMVLAAGMAVKLDLVESRCIRPERVAIVPPPASHVDNADCLAIQGQCRSVVTSDVFDDYGATAAVIDAFARLDRSQNDCLLFAVGNGPAEHRLRRHAEELDLCSRLTFVDRLDSRQLAGVFQAADIYISPRGGSSINFDALLAMASGAAVMAPEDYVSDFLIDGQTASMFRSRDARDIAEHLTEMLNDHQKTASLAAGALEHLDMNHRPDRIAVKIARACRSAMSPETSHVPLSA
jgi:glycosyltransferase involved in cell wall biosynthesis